MAKKINTEILDSKAANIGEDIVEILTEYKEINKIILSDKEKSQMLNDYIFGVSDENPLAELSKEKKNKLDHQDYRMRELFLSADRLKGRKSIED